MTHGNAFRDHSVKLEVHRVRVGRKFWLFRFSPQWGPLLTDEWGDPIDNTPLSDEAHPFWDAFEAWQAASASRAQRSELPQPSTSARQSPSPSPISKDGT